MSHDQWLRFVVTPLGLVALLWSLNRIRHDIRGIGGLPGLARKLGYVLGRLWRRLVAP